MGNHLRSYCNINKPNDLEGFFFSNKGLRIIFRMIQFFIRNKNKGNINIDFSEFFQDFSGILDDRRVKSLQKYYGEAGASKAAIYLLRNIKRNNAEKYKEFKLDLNRI